MEWTKPEFSRQEVNAAGQTLLEDHPPAESIERALHVINNWRASHAFPLKTFQATLRKKSKDVNKYPVVAQRLKRLSAIHLKLGLIPTLRLSQMQDIGGCRCVVPSVGSVYRLKRSYRQSRLRHELVHADDYISEPKGSGYRGVHLVYRYTSDKNPDFNGLKVEIQLRTRLQHAWATAVETVSTFTDAQLKSGIGSNQWLRFFELMGAAIARRERQPLVPDTPENEGALRRELREYVNDLDIIEHLASYRALLNYSNKKPFDGVKYFLLELDAKKAHVRITRYSKQEAQAASKQYLESERPLLCQEFDGANDAVLVSVDSMKALRQAYPNYFADTRIFLRELQRATE